MNSIVWTDAVTTTAADSAWAVWKPRGVQLSHSQFTMMAFHIIRLFSSGTFSFSSVSCMFLPVLPVYSTQTTPLNRTLQQNRSTEFVFRSLPRVTRQTMSKEKRAKTTLTRHRPKAHTLNNQISNEPTTNQNRSKLTYDKKTPSYRKPTNHKSTPQQAHI